VVRASPAPVLVVRPPAEAIEEGDMTAPLTATTRPVAPV
jgi:hypothetical protein